MQKTYVPADSQVTVNDRHNAKLQNQDSWVKCECGEDRIAQTD